MKKLVCTLLLLAVSFEFSACVSTTTTVDSSNPGSGKSAARGFTTSEPVISALERYKDQKGNYPGSIKELYPNYMTIIPKTLNGYPLEYKRDKQDYRLSFRYKEDRLNECAYTPEAKWQCRAL